MTLCFYCETNVAITIRYNEPTCDECKKAEYSTITDPHKEKKMSEKDKANRLKMIMFMFKHAKEEKQFIKESTDPEELMEWLSEKAKRISIQQHFNIEYTNFIDRWKQVFGSTENIPQSFKDNINIKYKAMRTL